jgi:hypothetical protein
MEASPDPRRTPSDLAPIDVNQRHSRQRRLSEASRRRATERRAKRRAELAVSAWLREFDRPRR